jgi:hypothetical protein
MGDDKQAKKAAKADKKAAKAEVKAIKAATAAAGTPTDAATSDPTPQPAPSSRPSPAERSAAAAEQAVAINKRRLRVQAVAAVITLAAVLVTLWSYLKPSDATDAAPTPPVATQPVAD